MGSSWTVFWGVLLVIVGLLVYYEFAGVEG
jgi:hypothetical protein